MCVAACSDLTRFTFSDQSETSISILYTEREMVRESEGGFLSLEHGHSDGKSKPSQPIHLDYSVFYSDNARIEMEVFEFWMFLFG